MPPGEGFYMQGGVFKSVGICLIVPGGLLPSPGICLMLPGNGLESLGTVYEKAGELSRRKSAAFGGKGEGKT